MVTQCQLRWYLMIKSYDIGIQHLQYISYFICEINQHLFEYRLKIYYPLKNLVKF